MATSALNTGEQERVLLAAARDGDERAFGSLVEPRRAELHAHCYQMLGSVHDAEDALQEALLRAWRGLTRFKGHSSLRSWLYKIATNACLDLIGRRRRRVLPMDYGPAFDPHGAFGEPLSESVWIEPYPDEALGSSAGLSGPEAAYEHRESVELAFVAALQHLPVRQRAVLVLREVLGFSALEVAETLETTVASVNSALQRARATLDARLPDHSQQATLRSLGDDKLREIVEGYVQAMEAGDVEAVIGLLTEDVAWSMPPTPTWYQGHDAIRAFLVRGPFTLRWRHRVVRANGQVAVAGYAYIEDRGGYVAYALDVLALQGDRIAEITAFLDPAVFARFGLPDRLPD